MTDRTPEEIAIAPAHTIRWQLFERLRLEIERLDRDAQKYAEKCDRLTAELAAAVLERDTQATDACMWAERAGKAEQLHDAAVSNVTRVAGELYDERKRAESAERERDYKHRLYIEACGEMDKVWDALEKADYESGDEEPWSAVAKIIAERDKAREQVDALARALEPFQKLLPALEHCSMSGDEISVWNGGNYIGKTTVENWRALASLPGAMTIRTPAKVAEALRQAHEKAVGLKTRWLSAREEWAQKEAKVEWQAAELAYNTEIDLFTAELAQTRARADKLGQLLAHVHLHLTNDEYFDAEELEADMRKLGAGKWIDTESLLIAERERAEKAESDLILARNRDRFAALPEEETPKS